MTEEVKFHTKPTQINRENPILIIENEYYKVWVYPLNNGYFAGFMVHSNGMSEAAIVEIELSGVIHWVSPTSIDVHTRQDLVKFVKEHDSYTEEMLFNIYEDMVSE